MFMSIHVTQEIHKLCFRGENNQQTTPTPNTAFIPVPEQIYVDIQQGRNEYTKKHVKSEPMSLKKTRA